MRLQSRLLALFALLFAFALGLRFLLTYQYRKEQSAEINTNIRNVVSVVHFATQRLSLTQDRDREALTRFVSEAVGQHPALKEISIVNVNQEIIAGSNPDKVGKRQSDAWRERMLKGQVHNEDTLDWYELAIPVVKGREVIGHVQASIRLSDVSQPWTDLYSKNVVVSLVLLVAVSVVSFLAIRAMTRPLAELVQAARRVAAGDLSARVTVAGAADEQAEVALAFNTMTEALGEQRKLEERLRELERSAILSETAATMAHEVRNPLNLINLTAGHLANQFLPESEAKREEYLKLIENLKAQVKHLNSMVTEFLAVGKPMKLRRTRFHLADLVGEAEVLVRQHMMLKGVALECNVAPDMVVTADQEQMRLVVLNVLLNAIEVSPSGERIVIDAGGDRDGVTVNVCDSGPGIPADDLEKVFKPYFAKRPGGTGLGLTLVRRIVEEHGGRVLAANGPDGGACFTISLPHTGADHGSSTDSR